MTNLLTVDWSTIPAPQEDGGALHLVGTKLPSLPLVATNGQPVDLSALRGTTVVYAYPMTGKPGVALPDGWDMLPGARGCTPQSCAFRDHAAELKAAGADHLFGLSTQTTEYQAEAAQRLHLPFSILSDANLDFTRALKLPVLTVDKMTLTKRLTMVIRNGQIIHVFYPVFPPDQNPIDVAKWLLENPSQ